jgi:E3 ubiquitin-protein ligase MYCBP2
LCGICYTSELASEPCIGLKCRHIFHSECLKKRLSPDPKTRTRLTFAFLRCPLCAVPISSVHTDTLVEKHVRMQRLICDRIWEQIDVDQLDTDARVTEPSSIYHNDVLRFAIDTYNYFECNRCKKPYFGGRRECDAGVDNAAGANARPEDYICQPCLSSASVSSCSEPTHQDSLVWKCRYCCSPAVWFCGGTTHYCDPCTCSFVVLLAL